jgi:glycosyltransferase involved in cell wall biosynthesis
VAEALSCGLPVIVGNLTAPQEYVNPENGLLVPPDDIKAIAAAMQQMIASAGTYDAASIRARVTERFGFENFGKKLADIYRSFL